MVFPEFNLAQIIGLFAFLATLYSFSRKQDNHFIYGQIFSALLWTAHYGMMTEFAAAAVTATHVIRYGSAPFARKNAAWRLPTAIAVAALYLLCGVLFTKEPIDWMPIIASVIGSFAVAFLSGVHMRIIFLLISACWLTFNLASHSIGGVLTDMSMLTMNTITIFRLRRDQRMSALEKPADPPA